ncbi:hypothetical protein J2X31_000579 [Flavobacterium arsenatis]|uniref:DUF4249 family protein n=1 Tax=Flavobacterium arsenatis TaxID=1484332 RepID=A0ABU1TL54_9FLAO|nr:hypothetical protein [Flavobacterium arsenatis]MDR6966581.1 hypothetical protein [Flavobacterium arsenatis]
MKTNFKIIATAIITSLLFACSSNDDNQKIEVVNIDATSYVLAGKILNNHLTIITFNADNQALIKSLEQDIQVNYSVHGDTIKIENYGFIKIQDNAIVSSDIDGLDFDQAELLLPASENAFKDKDFGGIVATSSGMQFQHYVRFSSDGSLYGISNVFNQATPNSEYELIYNIAGTHQTESYTDIFYLHNNILFYEIVNQQFGIVYYYSEGLSQQ